MSTRSFRSCLALCAGLATVVLATGAGSAARGAAHGTAAASSGPGAGDAVAYLRDHLAQFNLSTGDLADVVATDSYTDSYNGVTHVYLQQRYNGLKVIGGEATVTFGANDHVLLAESHAVPLAGASAGQMKVGAVGAVEAAADVQGLDLTEPLVVIQNKGGADHSVVLSDGGVAATSIPAKLVYQTLEGGGVRLAWQVEIREDSGDHWWMTTVDAQNGDVLASNDLIDHDSFGGPPTHPIPGGDGVSPPGTFGALLGTGAQPIGPLDGLAIDGSTYNVFPVPFENRNDGPESIVTNPADVVASPFGWHDTNAVPGPEFTITRGNNVYAYADQDSNNAPDFGSSPDGGPGLAFNFPFLRSEHAENYQPFAVTSLFYYCNIIHDISYRHGFTEQAGNYQTNNYGRTTFTGGNNDAVNCEAEDGSGTNNANFSPGSDGTAGRMQMFLWPSTGSQNQVVVPGVGAGTFNSSWARFGPAPSVAGTAGQIINAGNGCIAADYASAPTDADWIAIVTGSNAGCQNIDKARTAGTVGAKAIIIALNASGSAAVLTGSLTTAAPTIPAASITQADGNTIRTAIAAGTVTGTVRKHPSHPGIRDGDVDADVVYHEYGHGISNRLTGGRTTSNCLGNDEQGGEGWSDWQSISLAAMASDNGTARRGLGTYVLFQDAPFRNSTGIRTTAYSTNMSINPSTYDSIKTAAIPHGVGYVWASMLWEMMWNLTGKYGFNPNPYGQWDTGGNNLAMQLVMDGMKNQVCSPGFADARNAILASDVALTGGPNGADKCLIWRAFAKRGLGFNAVQGSSGSRSDGTQNFETHPDCRPRAVPAPTAISDSLSAGTLKTVPLTVSNGALEDGNNLAWTITETTSTCSTPSDVPWVSESLTSGSTVGAGSTNVQVTLDTSGLTAPSTSTGKLCLQSNDATTPTVEVPLSLVVWSVTITPDRSPDFNGWYTHAVTFTASAGVPATCDAPIVYNGPDTGTGSAAMSCTVDGNPGSATAAFKFDGTDPLTTATLNPGLRNGWYASPTLTLTGDDGTGSGIARIDYSRDGGTWTQYTAPLSGFSTGNHFVQYRATDNAGRVEVVRLIAFKADAVKPSVNITTPAEGASYPLDKVVKSVFKCTDNESGMDTCVGTVANGANISTSTVGDHTFTVTGTDKAGNVTVVTHHYQVTYTWNGFFSPVTNTEDSKLNLVHAGDLIKVGFSLDGDRGLSVFGTGSPSSSVIPCPSWTPHSVPAGGVGSTPGLAFGVASGHYTYGWQTSAGWAGSCRRFEIQLNDGTSTIHSADFLFFA